MGPAITLKGVNFERAIRDHRSGGFRGYAARRVDPGGIDLAESLDHHVAVPALPIVIVFEQNCADQPDDAVLVRTDPDHVDPPLHFLVQVLKRFVLCNLMRCWALGT